MEQHKRTAFNQNHHQNYLKHIQQRCCGSCTLPRVFKRVTLRVVVSNHQRRCLVVLQSGALVLMKHAVEHGESTLSASAGRKE